VSLIDFVTALAQNVALLLALTFVYSIVHPVWVRARAALAAPLAGIVFGLIAIAGMHTPIVIVPGVIADARLIPVLLAGPFAGAGAALTAGLVAGLYRVWLGGLGWWAGVGTIVSAAVLGALVAIRWRSPQRPPSPLLLVVLGLGLDAIVLAWAVALPSTGLAREVLASAAVPVGLFLPIGTLVLGVLLVNQDRRHAERERLTLMQVSLQRTGDAVLWVDGTGCVVNANPAAVTLTGRAPDELTGMRLWDLDATVTPEEWRWLWATAREAGRISSESLYRRRDGAEVPVETSTDFVEYRGREWLSVFVRDITERKRAERERTEQLAREQALRVQAEDANVLKDQFLATLSHELRTPLTSILGYARLLREGSLQGPAVARALEVIERNTRAQAQIVNDLLDVSSIVLGKLRIEPEPIDLGLVVDTEVEAMRPDAESRQITVHALVEAGIPRVPLDAGRMQQVVRNLLSNALKFTLPGGHVSVRVDTASDDALRLVVQDTGQGIDPAFLPHVFERFRQADNTLTRSHGGLGVGLAIVRHIVELHGGAVAAESEGRGKGSTFTVTLPLPSGDARGHDDGARAPLT
jgi:PAS domain S-box-containing protein